MISWLIFYLLVSLFNYWIVFWGGAQRIEGWLSFILVGWFAWDWKAEQIRFYVSIMWFVFTLLFIYGLFNQDFRDEYLFYYFN